MAQNKTIDSYTRTAALQRFQPAAECEKNLQRLHIAESVNVLENV